MEAITIEQVEALANELEADVEAQRARLERLIRAEARIVYAREPEQFKRQATEYSDEDGHWDNSYPPKQQYKNRTGPRTIVVREHDWDQIATSGGQYHSWKAVPSELGLYVDRMGNILGGSATGTGHFSQYAARPGDDQVEIEIEWECRDADELTLDDLREVEARLRALAFPLRHADAS